MTIWVIFIIWFVLVLIGGVVDSRTDKDVFVGFFLLSVPLMFYLPLFIK